MEGPTLPPELWSFVGQTPVPLRHGFTMGEHALFRNSQSETPCELSVIPMEGWQRIMDFQDTGLPWVMPSPNLPTPETCLVYAGTVLFEGTNVSEGRGTTRPFHLIGAPYIDARLLAKTMAGMDIAGAVYRPAEFKPMFGKWAGEVCGGVEIHPLNRAFRPFLAALALLESILRLYPEDFRLKDGPYEYETDRRAVDLILGSVQLFDDLKAGESARNFCRSIEPRIKAFDRRRTDYLLYGMYAD
jgi:uncharacterized protein YbbC (DUF1343 family)